MQVNTLVVILTVLGGVGACYDKTDCKSCTAGNWGWFSCRWCALSNKCHAPGSHYSDCESSQNILKPSHCYEVKEPPMKYDSSLAEELAKWSSLAYVTPKDYDRASIQRAVSKLINPNYQVVEFLTADCDEFLDFSFCAAVVAKSKIDKRIVVAFRGTSSTDQIHEQVLTALTGMVDFPPTGGSVLKYNKNTHDSLYPCVKSLVRQLLSEERDLEIIVTGHSLGGTLAQLTAANMLKDSFVIRSQLQVYTFGSPRVGNTEFAFGYDRLLGNSWRVTRKDDPIPLVIPTHTLGVPLGYHTRREVYYDTDGLMNSKTKYNICKGNEESDGCTRGEGMCMKADCFNKIHQKYFVKDLPRYISSRLEKGTPAAQESRGQCKSYIF